MVDQNALTDVVNEYRRVQRQIEAKRAQLDEVLRSNEAAGKFPVDFAGALPRRYAVELRFAAGNKVAQEQSVQIARGTVFRCAYVETFVRAVGTAADPFTTSSVTVQTTLSWADRLSTFDFLWRVRDTGSDREWCDHPQPSLFAGGGYLGPLWLPRRVVLGGGTALFVQVAPFLNNTAITSGFFTGGTVSEYIVQFSFSGHEVPDNEPI